MFKKGKSSEMDSYRPISVLWVALKIFERAVHCQLYQFLSRYQILSPYECSFWKNHSTESASISFTHCTIHGMDQGLLTGMAFTKLWNIFDTADHKIIVSRLEAIGISGTELSKKSYSASQP